MNILSTASSNQMRDIEPTLTPTEIQALAGMRDQFTLAQFAHRTQEQGIQLIINTFQNFRNTITQMFADQAELNNEYHIRAETAETEVIVAAALHREEMRALSERVDQLANSLREANTRISTLEGTIPTLQGNVLTLVVNHSGLANRFNDHQHSYRKSKKGDRKDAYTAVSNK